MTAPAATNRKPRDAATITAALLSLITALDGAPKGSPAFGAYRSAIRRRGEELSAAGGPEAMRAAIAAARAASPEHADAREAFITAAWASVTGWTP